jgi:PAS domain S-box-containing protein
MAHTLREELLATAEELADLGSWSLDLETMACHWSDGMYRIHGLTPQSTPPSVDLHLTHVHPDDRDVVRDAIRRLAADPAAFDGRTLELDHRLVRPDGSVREVRARGRVEAFGGGGGRFFGVHQDVTEQRMSERELLAHYGVAQALREWQSFDEGVVVLLRRMATALDFPSAAMWTWDERAGELVCRAVWSRPDFDSEDWEASTKALQFRPGEGLPGRAWTTLQPVFSPDVSTDPRFRRPEEARALGIMSALLFPAIGPNGPVAVLAFFSYERLGPSEQLLRTLSGIGTELGRFLDRRRAQLEPSPLSPREREVLSLAAEGLSGPQIAERLVVSPSTVKTHFENIYEKLGVSDRPAAVAHGLRTGLIQ